MWVCIVQHIDMCIYIYVYIYIYISIYVFEKQLKTMQLTQQIDKDMDHRQLL